MQLRAELAQNAAHRKQRVLLAWAGTLCLALAVALVGGQYLGGVLLALVATVSGVRFWRGELREQARLEALSKRGRLQALSILEWAPRREGSADMRLRFEDSREKRFRQDFHVSVEPLWAAEGLCVWCVVDTAEEWAPVALQSDGYPFQAGSKLTKILARKPVTSVIPAALVSDGGDDAQ